MIWPIKGPCNRDRVSFNNAFIENGRDVYTAETFPTYVSSLDALVNEKLLVDDNGAESDTSTIMHMSVTPSPLSPINQNRFGLRRATSVLGRVRFGILK